MNLNNFQVENLQIKDVATDFGSSNIPFKLSFEIKKDGRKMGTCQLSMDNLLNRVQLGDNQHNDFTFKPFESRSSQTTGKKVCEACGKGFINNYRLTEHVNSVHLGLKPFHCNTCGKSFSRRNGLRVHQQTHNADKRYKCDECGKSYVYKHRLKEHIDVVHKDLIMFQCKECGKAYSKKHDLKRHVDVVHEGYKRHKCAECGECFGWCFELEKHQKRTKHQGKETVQKPSESESVVEVEFFATVSDLEDEFEDEFEE